MFKVHQKQEDVAGEKAFVDKVEGYIAEDILKRRVSAIERERLPIRAMVVHAIAVARSYGQETERDLMLFALNMITINPEWHRQPRIHSILRDKTLTGPVRREKLLTDVSEDDWEQAGKMIDEDEYWSRHLPTF